MSEPIRQIMARALELGVPVPAFNIPYLPMMAPVVAALRDCNTFALIQVARLELLKFEARSLAAIRAEYIRCHDPRYTRLHLDHCPVIDEDNLRADYLGLVREALALGYDSVMVDGSRLPLAENIAATRTVVEAAHAQGVPVEAELGAVLGHEAGPLPPYEELYASGKGFTDPDEAARFVRETGCDWLSVAIGNIHGAISGAAKERKKPAARLNIAHLDRLRAVTGVPLVLHGGTGIRRECQQEAAHHGIAKVNIGTGIRQPYEQAIKESPAQAAAAVYAATVAVLREELAVAGSAPRLNPVGG